jgi:protein ImuB
MQLEQVRLPGPVRGVRVRVGLAVPQPPCQSELFPDAEAQAHRELARLVDRLGSRLGRACVLRPHCEAEAQPEYAGRFVPLTDHEATTAPPTPPASVVVPHEALGPNDRPLRLHHPPRAVRVMAVVPDGPPLRFQDQQRWHQVARCWGPERIETGWWRGRTVRRDYYRVETRSGHRFWLFRRLDGGEWFLQGEFA